MATVDDVEVANASFPNVRQDLNDILEAITTNFSADTEPTTTYPNQFWYETDTNLLYIRNEADDAWITLASINQTSGEWEPRTAVIQAIDSAGIALKTDDGTTRFSISDAGVVSFENYAFPSADGTAGQVLSTDGSGTLTFEDAGAGDKIEEGNSSVEVVDTGTGHVAITTDGSERLRVDDAGNVGIGTTSPNLGSSASGLHIKGAATKDGIIKLDSSDSNTSGWVQFTENGTDQWRIAYDPSNNHLEFTESGVADRMILKDGGDLQFNSGYGSVATAYGCRAWANINGASSPASIRDSGGISSITDNGTGEYVVNLSVTMPDVNYSVVVSDGVENGNWGSNRNVIVGADPNAPYFINTTTTSFQVLGFTTFGTYVDISRLSIAVFR